MKGQQVSSALLLPLFFLVNTIQSLLFNRWLGAICVGLLSTSLYSYNFLSPQEWSGEVTHMIGQNNKESKCLEEIHLGCGENIDPAINKKLSHFLMDDAIWEVNYKDQTTATNCTQQIIRTWQATHKTDQQLQQHCVQTINLQDNTPPVAEQVAEAANITVNRQQEMALLTVLSFRPSFKDNCTATDDIKVELVSSEVIIDKTCPKQQTHIRTWVGVDACGNTSAPYEQIVIAEDENCRPQSWANQ